MTCLNRANPKDPGYRPPSGVHPIWGRSHQRIEWPSKEALAAYAWWKYHTEPPWVMLDGGTIDLELPTPNVT